MRADVLTGDCLAVMATLDAASVDAIVSDPPYGLGFMGKAWDHGVPGVEFWREALRVAKPGAHLVAFGGTRTYHRLACAIEDAGWEIRDGLMWLYGSGFPKSLDVSKALDKAAGIERNEAPHTRPDTGFRFQCGGTPSLPPSTEAAREWSGWGTALKPAWEPIILARKPLAGTVAANVTAHGTGALNIDGCRVKFANPDDKAAAAAQRSCRDQNENRTAYGRFENGEASLAPYLAQMDKGRWPANVVLDEDAAAALDAQSGITRSNPNPNPNPNPNLKNAVYGRGMGGTVSAANQHGDTGGASRFFYTAKASRAERNAGLDHIEPRITNTDTPPGTRGATNPRAGAIRSGAARNHHPTVKPLDLMQWLCRLVTPKGGLILDPFCGSGTTGRAAVAEGFRFLGIELSEEYAAIARAPITDYAPLFCEVPA